MNRLAQLLTGSGPEGSRVLESAILWRPGLPLGVLLILGAAALALALWALFRETRARPVRFAVLGILRVAVFLLVGMVLLNPVLSVVFRRDRLPTLAILMDDSRSMSLRDVGSSATLEERLEAVKDVIVGDPLQTLGQRFDVKVFTFSKDLVPRSSLRREETPEEIGTAISAIEADGAESRLGSAILQLSEVLRGRETEAAILISDGRDTGGANPIAAAREWHARGIPIHCVAVGSDSLRDIRVEPILADRYGFLNDPLEFTVSISAFGFAGTSLEVRLVAGEKEVDRKRVTLTADPETLTVSLEYTPDSVGPVECRVEVPVQPGEIVEGNNIQSHSIEVLDTPMRVLFVEELPRWEFRFLRNALTRDPRMDPRFYLKSMDSEGIVPGGSFLPAFPSTRENLFEFDLVVLGDFPENMLTGEQYEWLRDFVLEEGGGILFLAGPRYLLPYRSGSLSSIIPVSVEGISGASGIVPRERGYRPRLTNSGRNHPILSFFSGTGDAWQDLPELYWFAPAGSVRGGAVVLAEHPWETRGTAPIPLVAFQYAGRGRSLYVGMDETFRWRFRGGNRDFYGFWGRAIQFLAMPHLLGRSDRVQFEVPASVSAGEAFEVSARVLSPDGDPVEQDRQTLVAQLGDLTVETYLSPVANQPGLYRGRLILDDAGRYRLFLREAPEEGTEEIVIRESPVEFRNPNANRTLLSRIARVSGGQSLELSDLPAFIASLRGNPVEERWVEETPLWDKLWLILALTILLSAEWVTRKLWSMM